MELKKRIWTVPNFLSLFRLLTLGPVFYYLNAGNRTWALVWMLIGLATDSADGWIARKFNQHSDLGKALDPLADKICVLSVMIYLVSSAQYHYPAWYCFFLIIRELFILLGGIYVVHKKSVVPKSNRSGKNSAFITGLTVLLYVITSASWVNILVWLSFWMTLYSTWQYTQSAIQILKGDYVVEENEVPE
jgi:CDP-diacylglycerol--glycerol-3-phosphate 3-phosphatidyltransferase